MIVSMAVLRGPMVSKPSVREPKPARFPGRRDNLQDVAGVASQTVQLPHGEHVPAKNIPRSRR